MPSGSVILRDVQRFEALLLDVVRRNSDGVWVEVGQYYYKTVSVEGLGAGDVVEIRGLNTEVQFTPPPLNALDPRPSLLPYNARPLTTQQGSLIATITPATVPGAIANQAWKWLKATKVDGGEQVPTTVRLHGTRE